MDISLQTVKKLPPEGTNKPRDYFLIVENSSRRLETRLRRHANLVFRGYFVNGVTIYQVKVESLEMLRRLKISLKLLEHSSQVRILKFEPLLRRDDLNIMLSLHSLIDKMA